MYAQVDPMLAWAKLGWTQNWAQIKLRLIGFMSCWVKLISHRMEVESGPCQTKSIRTHIKLSWSHLEPSQVKSSTPQTGFSKAYVKPNWVDPHRIELIWSHVHLRCSQVELTLGWVKLSPPSVKSSWVHLVLSWVRPTSDVVNLDSNRTTWGWPRSS